jgi:dTDP-4-amino-4,6-dideoxygalactose transaminase
MNNNQYAKLIPGLRHNGHASYAERDPRYYWKPAMSNVDVDIEGIWPNNFCIGEVQCALGSAMLPRIQEINDLRRGRFLKFEEATKNIQQITLQKFYPSAISTHHLLPFLFSGRFVSRDFVIEKLAYEYGIQAVIQYYPLNRYPLFYKNGFGEASIPNTDKLFDNMVSLPFHQWMTVQDFDYVIQSTLDCIDKYDRP